MTSPHLLAELEGILENKFGFSKAAAVETRSELEVLADLIAPTDIPKTCRDPDDDHFLAAAVAGGVEVIVTGDRDLLVLDWHGDFEILTPTSLVLRLRADE